MGQKTTGINKVCNHKWDGETLMFSTELKIQKDETRRDNNYRKTRFKVLKHYIQHRAHNSQE